MDLRQDKVEGAGERDDSIRDARALFLFANGLVAALLQRSNAQSW